MCDAQATSSCQSQHQPRHRSTTPPSCPKCNGQMELSELDTGVYRQGWYCDGLGGECKKKLGKKRYVCMTCLEKGSAVDICISCAKTSEDLTCPNGHGNMVFEQGSVDDAHVQCMCCKSPTFMTGKGSNWKWYCSDIGCNVTYCASCAPVPVDIKLEPYIAFADIALKKLYTYCKNGRMSRVEKLWDIWSHVWIEGGYEIDIGKILSSLNEFFSGRHRTEGFKCLQIVLDNYYGESQIVYHDEEAYKLLNYFVGKGNLDTVKYIVDRFEIDKSKFSKQSTEMCNMLGSFNGGSYETKFNIEQCIKYVLKSGKIRYSDEEFVLGFSWFSFTCSPDMASFMIDNYSDKFLPLEKDTFSHIVRHRNIPVLKYLLEHHYQIVADSISDGIKIACDLITSHGINDSELVKQWKEAMSIIFESITNERNHVAEYSSIWKRKKCIWHLRPVLGHQATEKHLKKIVRQLTPEMINNNLRPDEVVGISYYMEDATLFATKQCTDTSFVDNVNIISLAKKVQLLSDGKDLAYLKKLPLDRVMKIITLTSVWTVEDRVEILKKLPDKTVKLMGRTKEHRKKLQTLMPIDSYNEIFSEVAPDCVRTFDEKSTAMRDMCICPITQELMVDPVMTTDGHTYERVAIERWFANGTRRSPKTNAVLEDTSVFPNVLVRQLIAELDDD